MRRASRTFSLLLCAVLASAGLLAVATAQPAGAATHDDTVFAFGAATFNGSTSGHRLAKPVIAMATTANGAGYWLLAEDGAVFSYNAPYYGNATNRTFF